MQLYSQHQLIHQSSKSSQGHKSLREADADKNFCDVEPSLKERGKAKHIIENQTKTASLHKDILEDVFDVYAMWSTLCSPADQMQWSCKQQEQLQNLQDFHMLNVET